MTCYFRHLGEIFRKAGITVTSENRKEVDRIVHNIVGMKHKSCPDAWREVKKRIAENEAQFVSELRQAWENRK
jgi:ribosomal protein L17